MKELVYCPKCGAATLQWNGIQKLTCSSCSFSLYHNVAGAVAVVIRCENELFLTRRNRNPQKGKRDLAGGFVDPKETAEETCARELKEELNITIEPKQLKYLGSNPNVYLYNEISYNTIDLFYEYVLQEKQDFQLEASELQEGLWISLNDLKLEDLAFESQKIFFQENYGI